MRKRSRIDLPSLTNPKLGERGAGALVDAARRLSRMGCESHYHEKAARNGRRLAARFL